MKCPYRKVHEYDHEGLCRHCYAKAPPFTADMNALGGVTVTADGDIIVGPPKTKEQADSIWKLLANANPIGWAVDYISTPPRED